MFASFYFEKNSLDWMLRFACTKSAYILEEGLQNPLLQKSILSYISTPVSSYHKIFTSVIQFYAAIDLFFCRDLFIWISPNLMPILYFRWPVFLSYFFGKNWKKIWHIGKILPKNSFCSVLFFFVALLTPKWRPVNFYWQSFIGYRTASHKKNNK